MITVMCRIVFVMLLLCHKLFQQFAWITVQSTETVVVQPVFGDCELAFICNCCYYRVLNYYVPIDAE